jgi:hypothetical protein
MYAVVRDRHGEEQQRFDVPDVGALDCDIYAAIFADECGFTLEGEDRGRIPDGCEDYSVTLCEDPNNRAHCWSSANYMVVGESK